MLTCLVNRVSMHCVAVGWPDSAKCIIIELYSESTNQRQQHPSEER